jgi:hypothetical protein
VAAGGLALGDPVPSNTRLRIAVCGNETRSSTIGAPLRREKRLTMGMSHWRERHNGMMARSMTRSLAKSRSRALPRAGAIAACFNRGVYLGSNRSSAGGASKRLRCVLTETTLLLRPSWSPPKCKSRT